MTQKSSSPENRPGFDIPHISKEEAFSLAAQELDIVEDLGKKTSSLPREFHPKAIKKEYRLRAILWSTVLAIVMISGMIGNRNKWASMVPNLLRMMSGQSTETTGLPEGVGATQNPENLFPPEVELPSISMPLPPDERVATPETAPSVERHTYPAINLKEDETLCRNKRGSYRAFVEPIEIEGLKFFKITVKALDVNGRENIKNGVMLPVVNYEQRINDAKQCLEGFPYKDEDGENRIVYYVPVNPSQKASLEDTSLLGFEDTSGWNYFFPGMVMVKEGGEQSLDDRGNMGTVIFKNPDGLYNPDVFEPSGTSTTP